jgi:hypothetical protein
VAVDISLYNHNFINNVSLYTIITSYLIRGDFNARKGMFLGKAGIDYSIRLASYVNKYISKTNSINKSRDYK